MDLSQGVDEALDNLGKVSCITVSVFSDKVFDSIVVAARGFTRGTIQTVNDEVTSNVNTIVPSVAQKVPNPEHNIVPGNITAATYGGILRAARYASNGNARVANIAPDAAIGIGTNVSILTEPGTSYQTGTDVIEHTDKAKAISSIRSNADGSKAITFRGSNKVAQVFA